MAIILSPFPGVGLAVVVHHVAKYLRKRKHDREAERFRRESFAASLRVEMEPWVDPDRDTVKLTVDRDGFYKQDRAS